MTTVALTRCAYGITLPGGVNNVWTTALRCWANRKSCHVLTRRESSHPLINYEKAERGLLQSGSMQVLRERRQTQPTKVNKLCAVSPGSQEHRFVRPEKALVQICRTDFQYRQKHTHNSPLRFSSSYLRKGVFWRENFVNKALTASCVFNSDSQTV